MTSAYADPKHHTVRVTVTPAEDPEDAPDVEVGFTCTAPEDGLCRTWPDCDCEVFYEGDSPGHDVHGHPFVPGRPCWVRDWFDNGSAEYVGWDATDAYEHGHPAVEREGHVDVTFDGDYLQWTSFRVTEATP